VVERVTELTLPNAFTVGGVAVPTKFTQARHANIGAIFLGLAIPVEEVITRVPGPESATATKMDNSGDHITDHQLLSGDALVVQVIPSGLVDTLLPTPEVAVAIKIDNSGAHITERQSLSAADTRVVQVMPSGLVITLFPVPENATATKVDNSGDHATDNQ